MREVDLGVHVASLPHELSEFRMRSLGHNMHDLYALFSQVVFDEVEKLGSDSEVPKRLADEDDVGDRPERGSIVRAFPNKENRIADEFSASPDGIECKHPVLLERLIEFKLRIESDIGIQRSFTPMLEQDRLEFINNITPRLAINR